MPARRTATIALLALAAVVLAVAGAVEWRMMSPSIADLQARCSSRALLGCGFGYQPHRVHPLRAELLWAASATVALVAVAVALLPRRPGARPQPISD